MTGGRWLPIFKEERGVGRVFRRAGHFDVFPLLHIQTLVEIVCAAVCVSKVA